MQSWTWPTNQWPLLARLLPKEHEKLASSVYFDRKIGVVTIPNYDRQALVEDNNLLKISQVEHSPKLRFPNLVKAAEPRRTGIQL